MKIALIGKMGAGKSALSQWFVDTYKATKISFADELKKDILNNFWTIDGEIKKPRDRQLMQNYGQLRRGEITEMNITKYVIKQKPQEIGWDYMLPLWRPRPITPEMEAEGKYLKQYKGKILNLGGNCWAHTSCDRPILLGPCHFNYWVYLAIKKVEQLSENSNCIFDDIRRNNEEESLRESGFTIIKIDCPEDIRLQRLIARDGNFDPNTLNDISETQVDSIPFHYEIDNSGNLDNGIQQFDNILNNLHIQSV